MTRFEDHLLDDLMSEHGRTLGDRFSPASSRRRRDRARRPMLIAAGGGLAVAAAVAGTLANSSGSPAYAVTKHTDGAITLTVHRQAGIAGINAKLDQLGDGQVVVVPVEPGCPSLGSLPAPPVPATNGYTVGVTGTSSAGSVTVEGWDIPAGDIFVAAIQTSGVDRLAGGVLTSSPAPTCVSLPSTS